MNIVQMYDSSMLSGAIVVLNSSKEKVEYKCQEGISKARQNVEEAEVELVNSQRLLNEAITEEARCLQDVHYREAELASALSSYPINPAYVSYCQAMLHKAQVEYEKAVAIAKNMLAFGMSPEMITKITNLSEQDLKSIIS